MTEKGIIYNLKSSRPFSFLRRIYYDLRNWDTTKEKWHIYKDIHRFKNIASKEMCVVIGNGPSLRIEDLTRLYEAGIPTFACNRIHLAFSKTPWRPDYYFMSDVKLLASDKRVLNDAPDTECFYPYSGIRSHGKIHYYRTKEFDYEKEGKFSYNAAEGVYPAGTVTSEMIQFAYYMGFKKIYLIGVDFSYAVNHPANNRTYQYNGEKNYFIDGYMKEGEVADMPSIQGNLLGFNAARNAIESKKRIIKNATRGGKLEVFDRVDLDKLFEEFEKKEK